MATPHHNRTDETGQTPEAERAGACAPPAATSAAPDWGPPPTNRGPHNCINGPLVNVVRVGLDSLYLSYAGFMAPAWVERLEHLRSCAQSEDPLLKASAQVELCGHLLQVDDKGSGRFRFVLQDNAFHISLSRTKASGLPLAYVQVRSEYLTHVGPEEAERKVRFIVDSLGKRDGLARVSRADLHVDFTSPMVMDSWRHDAWVTRAHDVKPYYHKRKFTGWQIGSGGPVMARLYDKTLEITTKSRKYYLFELWERQGWSRADPVWRLEFELKREALKELGARTLDELLGKLGGAWRYATEDWLRLTVPNPDDQTQTRWPTHPMWRELSEVSWGLHEQPKLSRFRCSRIPSDEKLFPAGIGYIASFMAREGIEDFGEGLGEYLTGARRYFDHVGRPHHKGFERHLQEKITLKGWEYNTIRSQLPDPILEEMNRRQAEAYQKAKEGDDETGV